MFEFRPISRFDMGRNGFTNMVMESQEETDKIIEEFERRYPEFGYVYTTEMVLNEICNDLHINLKDLTDFDRKRLERTVEEIVASERWIQYD